MEKAVQYEECTKEELIQILVDQDQRIQSQDQTIRELSQALVEDRRRGYGVVQEHFTENYHGVLIHDCWSAQNNTPAGAHQLCHAHLVRNLQYAVDKERSVFAYRVQRLLGKSQRARDAIWQTGVSPQ